jgi:hypothetical protein
MNPFGGKPKPGPFDYALVVAALVVCAALVVWAFLG